MRYIFRLRVQSRRGDALIRVERSAKGRPRQRYHFPYSDEEQAALLDWFEEESLTSPEEADSKQVEVGQKLHGTLLPAHQNRRGDIWSAFQESSRAAADDGEPLTIQVRFDPETVPQAQLPWELLHDGSEHRVFTESLHFNRYITYYGDRNPFEPVKELNILYVISRPTDLEHLNHYAEKQEVASAFKEQVQKGNVHIDVLEDSTLVSFQNQLKNREYHVVHWDGHGSFPEGASEGLLAFETWREETDVVTASQFADALRGSSVRLVVLSACQSGTVRGNRVLNSVGPALIRARIPAVVAMQFSIPLASTVEFAHEFYRSLARGESVAGAVADGRKNMSSPWKTWFYPALYLRAAEGEGFLFSAEPVAHFEERQEDLAQLYGEWRKMPETEKVQYPEGPPDAEELFEEEDDFEEFMEMVEEVLDTIEDVQDMIDTIDDFLEAVEDSDDDSDDDDGGESGDDSPGQDAGGQGSDSAPAAESLIDLPLPPVPPEVDEALLKFAALLEGQGLLTVKGSLGAQYMIQPAGGGWGGGGYGDGTHTLEAGDYVILIGNHQAGRATIEKRKETTVTLDIALAHIKLAFEGAGYSIVDPGNNQMIGAQYGSADWHLKPGSYEVHFGQQGVITSFFVAAGEERDVPVDGVLVHIQLAFEGAGYSIVDPGNNQMVGAQYISADWHLKPGSYEVHFGMQGLITTFSVGPSQKIDVPVDGALIHIQLAFEGAGHSVIDPRNNQMVGAQYISADWHLKPGSYEVHFGMQGQITSFTVAARQKGDVPVQGALVHIQSIHPNGFSVVDMSNEQMIGAQYISGDWHLKPGTYQIRRATTEPPFYVVTGTFSVGPGQEIPASG